ncbi:P-loop containing nucleoside triphosphate hydrolase protein [Pelagophyceae sp. CCMP2097]|nr:P-loop containing nucleoside triphosphate hydrolase protein [Pelagophyceae sp. CCMP2097]
MAKSLAERKPKAVKALTKTLGREPTEKELEAYVSEKKASADEPTTSTPADEPVAKKEKKEKRKKEAVEEAPVVEEKPAKKSKKEKKAAAEPAAEEPPKKEKKEKKAKAAPVVVAAVSAADVAWRVANQVEVDPDDARWTPCITWDLAKKCVGAKYAAACAAKEWAAPTPIQAACWPIMAAKRDIVAIAETGSGKTLAFSLPALASFEKDMAQKKPNAPLMLVLAPTRELAQQSWEVVTAFTSPASAAVAYGGVPKPEQKRAIKTAVCLIATPGRLMDFFEEGAVDLSQVRWLVLDEADRMLDMGFVHAVKAIAKACAHPQRQVAMFSATWPAEVRQIAEDFLNPDYVRVSVGSVSKSGDDPVANKRVAQTVHVVEERARDAKLLQILKLRKKTGDRVIVFGLYKKECARLEIMLNRNKESCVAIHGDMSQQARNDAFNAFRSGEVPTLVATDVAARGLDIPNVEIVINFSFPLTIEDYVHRIGRTGRAGKHGIAETFFHGGGHEKALAGALQNVLRGAGCDVPAELLAYGSTVKKKEHKLYGAFGPKAGEVVKKAVKITF